MALRGRKAGSSPQRHRDTELRPKKRLREVRSCLVIHEVGTEVAEGAEKKRAEGLRERKEKKSLRRNSGEYRSLRSPRPGSFFSVLLCASASPR